MGESLFVRYKRPKGSNMGVKGKRKWNVWLSIFGRFWQRRLRAMQCTFVPDSSVDIPVYHSCIQWVHSVSFPSCLPGVWRQERILDWGPCSLPGEPGPSRSPCELVHPRYGAAPAGRRRTGTAGFLSGPHLPTRTGPQTTTLRSRTLQPHSIISSPETQL